MYNHSFIFLATLCSLLCFTKGSFAQATNASIIGVIMDDDGQPVSGASIQLLNESTGFTTSTSSNIKG